MMPLCFLHQIVLTFQIFANFMGKNVQRFLHLCIPDFWFKNPTIIWIVLSNMSSFWLVSSFLFHGFQQFDCDVSGHGVLGFILFELHRASWICGFMSFAKFRKFLVIICFHPAFLLPWEFSDTNVRHFGIVSLVSKALFIFIPILPTPHYFSY